MPRATKCVQCLTRSGDVALLKRFDETVDGSEIQTYFKKPGQYLQQALERRLGFPDFFMYINEES